MQNQKKTLHKTKASTPPITKVESRGNKPSKKLSLQNSKNSRTFDARRMLEQSNSKFLNQNKAQATGESPAYTFRFSDICRNDLSLFLIFKKMRQMKTITSKTKKLTPPTIKAESKNNKPSRKISLQNSKNSRTYETLTELEQSNSIFLNQRKTQANRCKSCNFRLSGSVVSDLGFYLQTKSHMTTEKTPTQKPTTGTPPTIKVEFENAQDFVIYAQYSHMRAVIRGLKRKHLPNFLHSLAAPYQQQ